MDLQFDRVVRLGDVWRAGRHEYVISGFVGDEYTRQWASSEGIPQTMILTVSGTPASKDWVLVRRASGPRDLAGALVRLREIADYHAARGGTDLDRALRSLGL